MELADQVGGANAVCNECHSDVFAEFEFNERHRLQEGVMGCTDCHSPHEPATRTHLAGFKQQQCVECHADKGGPFVFEHGSVQIEGCVACHQPHGAQNRHMLTFQNVAETCFSCHAVVPGFHARFTAETQCTSCHTTIHGSNFHPAFLK
jgi:DmsE family decaheme c-type cytochrome